MLFHDVIFTAIVL